MRYNGSKHISGDAKYIINPHSYEVDTKSFHDKSQLHQIWPLRLNEELCSGDCSYTDNTGIVYDSKKSALANFKNF